MVEAEFELQCGNCLKQARVSDCCAQIVLYKHFADLRVCASGHLSVCSWMSVCIGAGSIHASMFECETNGQFFALDSAGNCAMDTFVPLTLKASSALNLAHWFLYATD